MCFNLEVSLTTFVLGVFGSILLIKYGNSKYKKENTIFAYLAIFAILMQLVDAGIWYDLDNKIGLNTAMTYFGSFIVYLQPTFLYLLKIAFNNNKISLTSPENGPLAIANFIYLVYFIGYYKYFTANNKMVTSLHPTTKHLQWKWVSYAQPYAYLIMLAINFFYLTDYKYSFYGLMILYTLLVLSRVFFRYNTGEIWCFFGALMPFGFLALSYMI